MARVGEIEVGEITYNGYTFDGAYHAEIQSHDVMDESGRVVKYTEYTLSVRAIIADAAGSDTEMSQIHSLLSKSGQLLIIENIGVGSSIRVGGGVRREVMFGPIPNVRTWKPIGSSLACEVLWTCTFRLVECGGPTFIRGVMEANYSVDIDIDNNGNTVRTIAGHVVVVNHIVARKVTENPDLFRSWIGGVIPLGFKRNQHYSLNAAKNRVDFRLVDAEIPTHHNAFPLGMSEAKGSHRVSWRIGRSSGAEYRNSMQFTLTPRPDVSQSECFRIAVQIINQRMQKQRAAGDCDGKKAGTLVTALSIEESLWGRGVDVSVEWRWFTPLRKLMTDSGLFVPIAGTNWTQWRTSMANWGHHERGNAKWTWNQNDDVIVDLCNQTTIAINGDVASYPIGQTQEYGIINQKPTKENSYLKLEQAIVPFLQRPTARQAILQAADQDTGQTDMNDESHPAFGDGQSAGINTITQQSSRAVYSLLYFGNAERAGYPVPKPRLISPTGVSLKELRAAFSQRIIYNALGVPVYGAEWAIEYSSDAPLGEVKPESNIKEKVDKDGNACPPATNTTQ